MAILAHVSLFAALTIAAPEPPGQVLRAACDSLVIRQLPGGRFDSTSGAWWEAAYAVRALLAGYTVLRDPADLAAVARTLDAFIARQSDDGGFCSLDRNPTELADCPSRNTADLGTITACLSLAATHFPGPRGTGYIESHRKYIDRFALRHRLPTGAFRNGLYDGVDYPYPYTVATATQAVSLTTLFLATDDSLYLRQAEEAVDFILDDWSSDGRILFRPHDRPSPVRIESLSFHDLFYVVEACIWVHSVTGDDALRRRIEKTLRAYLYGSWGLLTQLGETTWYPPTAGTWAANKSNGMLGLLVSMRRIVGEERHLDRLISGGASTLTSPETRERYGILVPPLLRPGKKTGVSTAFAALSFAELAIPGASFGRLRPQP